MDQLQRFIDLVNKTGDKLVIFDRYQPDNSFVILGINDYEALVSEPSALEDLTEEELADKINSDIAIWKNEQILSDFSEEDDLDWPDEIDDWSVAPEEAVSEESAVSQVQEEELNYLYPEPELTTTPETVPDIYASPEPTEEVFTEPEPVATSSDELEAELEIPNQANSPKKVDFESLGDILGSKYEKSNSWTIPSDRKKQATDNLSNRYETIGF